MIDLYTTDYNVIVRYNAVFCGYGARDCQLNTWFNLSVLFSSIEKATDGSLQSEDWTLNMEICDIINETEDGWGEKRKRFFFIFWNNLVLTVHVSKSEAQGPQGLWSIGRQCVSNFVFIYSFFKQCYYIAIDYDQLSKIAIMSLWIRVQFSWWICTPQACFWSTF